MKRELKESCFKVVVGEAYALNLMKRELKVEALGGGLSVPNVFVLNLMKRELKGPPPCSSSSRRRVA